MYTNYSLEEKNKSNSKYLNTNSQNNINNKGSNNYSYSGHMKVVKRNGNLEDVFIVSKIDDNGLIKF